MNRLAMEGSLQSRVQNIEPPVNMKNMDKINQINKLTAIQSNSIGAFLQIAVQRRLFINCNIMNFISKKFDEDSDSEHSSRGAFNPNKQAPRIESASDSEKVVDQYLFPVKLVLIKKVEGLAEFKKLLKKEGANTGHDKGWNIMQLKAGKDKKEIFMLIKCKKCKACLKYKQNSKQQWILVEYKNQHYHIYEGDGGENDPKAKKEENGDEAVQKLKTEMEEEGHHPRPELNVKIANPPSLRLGLKQEKEQFENVLNTFKTLGYENIFRVDQRAPQHYLDFIIASNKNQKHLFKKYGERVNFDVSFHCLKQGSFSRPGLGLFSGLDNNNRIIIFAFVLIGQERKQIYKGIFDSFFDLMKSWSKTTSIMIFAQKGSLLKELEELKQEKNFPYFLVYEQKQFVAQFDSYIKSKIQSQQKHKELTQMLIDVLDQSVPTSGQFCLDLLRQELLKENMGKLWQKLFNKIDHVCLWKMPPQFIGNLLKSVATVEELLGVEKDTPNSNHLLMPDVITKLNEISLNKNNEHMNKPVFQTYIFEELFDDPLIREIKTTVEQQIFKYFIVYYKKSLDMAKQRYDLFNIVTKNRFKITEWNCSCQTSEKTGIPCEHIIYLHRTKQPRVSYITRFSRRWMAYRQIKTQDLHSDEDND